VILVSEKVRPNLFVGRDELAVLLAAEGVLGHNAITEPLARRPRLARARIERKEVNAA
jgi:hypothetical protein